MSPIDYLNKNRLLQIEFEKLNASQYEDPKLTNQFNQNINEIKHLFNSTEDIIHRLNHDSFNQAYQIDLPYIGKTVVRQGDIVVFFPIILGLLFLIYSSL